MDSHIDKPTVRKLIGSILHTSSDLNAFLIDYFESIYRRASSDPDQVAKINRLLTEATSEEIIAALRQVDPITLMKQSETLNGKTTPVVSNPFQQWGTLPSDSQTYIKRACDEQLATQLTVPTRISIWGPTQIGKSSLLKRIQTECSNTRPIYYVSFEDMVTHDCKIFHGRFFKRLGRELGAEIIDWDSLEDATRTQPFALFIDELGLLTDTQTIEQFIPRLLRFCDKNSVALVVAMPISILEYFELVHVTSPKHQAGWTCLEILPFSEHELSLLLNFLPKRSREITKNHFRKIVQLSKLRPQSAQKLCYALYEAEVSNQPEARLQELIYSKHSY